MEEVNPVRFAELEALLGEFLSSGGDSGLEVPLVKGGFRGIKGFKQAKSPSRPSFTRGKLPAKTNQTEKQKVIFIIGCTGSGKSNLSYEIVKKCEKTLKNKRFEILNADSRQFYADLGILTAKPSPEKIQKSNISHHGFGILPASQHTDAKWYQDWAKRKLNEVWERGNTPIVVGGTMLWADSLIKWYDFDQETTSKPKFGALVVAPWAKREQIYQKINERTKKMMEMGVLEEIFGFLRKNKGKGQEEVCHNLKTAIGLQLGQKVYDGLMTEAEFERKLAQATRKYAKRQLTWWRGRQDVIWVDNLH